MSLMQIQQIITQKLGKKKLHSCSHLVTANSQTGQNSCSQLLTANIYFVLFGCSQLLSANSSKPHVWDFHAYFWNNFET